MRRRFDDIGRALLARGLVIVTIGWAASAMAQQTQPPTGMPQQPNIQQPPGMQQQPSMQQQLPGMEQEARKQFQQAMPTMGAERVVSETDIVVNVDRKEHKLTLQDPQGHQVTINGQGIPNFDQIRDGDKVNVKYYQAAAIAIHKPGETASATELQTGAARVRSGRPTGMVGETITSTMSVVSVDQSKKQITLRSAAGKTQTFTAEDPHLQQNLSSLKPGDQISLSYTEAAAVSVMPQK